MGTQEVRVSASKSSNLIGIDFKSGQRMKISYVSGEYFFNPVHGTMRGTSGIDKSRAPSTYLAPGLPEGRLCARIGNSQWFDAHNFDGEVLWNGDLYLAINDEIKASKGKGYADNSGTLVIRVEQT